MTEKTKFTKREWIHLIITISIIEGFIFWVAFQFAGNSTALGYVSFAGTLISIILAVLAIGYTYGESHQQKNTSNTLANQIDSLIEIKDELKVQADALEDIKVLKSNLTNFSQKMENHFKETNLRIDSFKEDFQVTAKEKELHDEKEILNTSTQTNLDLALIVESLFGNNPTRFDKLILILSVLYFEDRKDYRGFIKVKKFLKNLEFENMNQEMLDTFFGGIVALSGVLSSLKLLSNTKDEIHPKMLEFFNAFINDSDKALKESFEHLGVEILERAKKSKYYK